MVDFFQAPPNPAEDPSGFNKQRQIASMLMQQGMQGQQGQMVNGHYVAPSPLSYLAQLGSAAAGGYRAGQLRDAARAADLLNGGTGSPQVPPIFGAQ